MLAHYFSLLIWQSQAMVYLISDPLGNGANMFGTSGYQIDYHVISYAAIWYVQVAALVAGHVGGLALAHDRALVLYEDPEEAVRSQYWMLAVMVAFTSFGLWLLSAVGHLRRRRARDGRRLRSGRGSGRWAWSGRARFQHDDAARMPDALVHLDALRRPGAGGRRLGLVELEADGSRRKAGGPPQPRSGRRRASGKLLRLGAAAPAPRRACCGASFDISSRALSFA